MQNWDHPSIQWDLRYGILAMNPFGSSCSLMARIIYSTRQWVYGWAAVVRNDSDFVRCISDFMKSTLNPFQSEILTVREAFYWLKSLHLDNIATEIGS
ncbi:hypothetical protein J1N35_027350 [Gossypium stocksii]|uniref:Uncharacterized protein n=1 Tax=Gossypium stocksii TaxID=47602 RepID=A0A9D3V9W6_9ROSI|nr:hypothetical protein J1N35_027350 [Gossypium stocksii]